MKPRPYGGNQYLVEPGISKSELKCGCKETVNGG